MSSIITPLKQSNSMFIGGNKNGRDFRLYFCFPSNSWQVSSYAMDNYEDEKLLYIGDSFEDAFDTLVSESE